MLFENDLSQNMSWKIRFEELALDPQDVLEEPHSAQRPLDRLFNLNVSVSLKKKLFKKWSVLTREESHSGGTAVEVYTTVTLLSILMSQQ